LVVAYVDEMVVEVEVEEVVLDCNYVMWKHYEGLSD
jgi:hypothetical protein